jgi:membrane protease YdiL (CAAX protease family)
MRLKALTDLALLAVAFWGVWALRFFGVENVGLWSMLASIGVGFALLAYRKETVQTIGLRSGGGFGWTLARAGEVGLLVLIVGAVGIGVATAIGFPPSTSSNITNQPEELSAFLLDILVGVWIGAALGEEIFFRGFLITKFRTLLGGGRFALVLAIIAQAVWFGAGHASQGLSGMIITGLAGLFLATYFVTRAKGSLIPMIIGHGLVNTIGLSISYVS